MSGNGLSGNGLSGNSEFTAKFFDESSIEWRKNKKPLANGMFKYVKEKIVKKALPLRRSPRFLKAY
jgi:hypothetical protein